MRRCDFVQPGGGSIVVSRLPADQGLGVYNATCAPTGQLVEGYPAYAAGTVRHLFLHPEDEMWQISYTFDPEVVGFFVARIRARGGPLPTGTRTWRVFTDAGFADTELTVCEVD